MSNQWEVFKEDDNDMVTTSNPLRKIKKKLRKKKVKYEKNPSSELFNEINELNNLINHLTKPTISKPKKKNKIKKFKKCKVNKAEVAAEKKRKKDRETLKKFNANYKKWLHDQNIRINEEKKRRINEEKKRRIKEEQERANLEYLYRLKQIQEFKYLPEDIKHWLSEPNRKGYFMLLKKYHPDKNKNTDNEYAKIITSHWDNIIKNNI